MRRTVLSIAALFCCLSIAFGQAYAPSPTWMKTGTYAEYEFLSIGLQFTNKSIVYFSEPRIALFSWQCVGLNGDIGKLNISLTLNNNNETLFFSTLTNVNLNNRTVFMTNGTSLGQTRLWGPSNPNEGELVPLWNANIESNSSDIIGSVNFVGSTQTLQGLEHTYQLYGSGEIRGIPVTIDAFYAKNSGVMIDGYIDTEPTLYALGINDPLRNGTQYLIKTNIPLGQSQSSAIPTENYLLGFVIATSGIFIISLLIIHKLRIKNRRKGHNR